MYVYISSFVYVPEIASGVGRVTTRINYLSCRAKSICNSTLTVKKLMGKGFRVGEKSIFQFLMDSDPGVTY